MFLQEVTLLNWVVFNFNICFHRQYHLVVFFFFDFVFNDFR